MELKFDGKGGGGMEKGYGWRHGRILTRYVNALRLGILHHTTTRCRYRVQAGTIARCVGCGSEGEGVVYIFIYIYVSHS